MSWKTYLVMYFGSDGNISVNEIVKKVESLGFVSTIGPVDFLYDWKNKTPSKEDIFELADKLKKTLQGTGTIFNLDTHD